MVNPTLSGSDCLCMAGCVFLGTNAIAAPTTLITANGDQIQGTADEVRVRSRI